MIALLIGAGMALWFSQYRPASPNLSQANEWSNFSLTKIQNVGSNLDHEVADLIRQTAKEGIKLPQVSNWSVVKEVSQSTVSATISTSPEEVWKTFREQGSQAVIGGLAQNAQVSVNDVSADVMNEARYQYCVGVVDEYERQRSEPKE